ncbi:hypothetical protein L915_10883 [Phytophthora nicotianae]|uniref:Uncharacterized protein n=1 Tax=Phytophthora nicotianae TaxID=4792 RepID=W2IVG6_PHYNI|nr:hypothetical protein L915_10883 [Phytophthora nicotianae]ETL37542.1 hypothetical protein L916_10776 [Phytophthora nicotianae]
MNDDGEDGVALILMLALAHEGQQEKDGAPHPYQEMTPTLLRRKLLLRAIKLTRVVLVFVQHNLPFICSSRENCTDDL